MHYRTRITKRRGIVVLILLTILTFSVVDSRFLGTGWIPDTGGFCLVSQSYGANSNSTYSVMFAGVNFTFLYWAYPPPIEGPNGTLITITDLPHTAYFLVTFDDDVEEILSLNVGGYVPLMPFQVPRGAKTNHSSPSAGVITADTSELWRNWQYTVNLYN